jgi:hypothetical protein
MTEVAYNVISAQEPWIKTQLKAAVNTTYDYFLNKTNTFSVTINLADLKTSLVNSFWQEYTTYLGAQLAGKSDVQITAYLQDIIRQIPQDILPPNLLLLPPSERNDYVEQYLRSMAGVAPKPGAPLIDPFTASSVNQYVNNYIVDYVNDIPNSFTIDESDIGSDTLHSFQDIRRGIGYFQTYYIWLIVALVVLVILIFLVNWDFKIAARVLGIELLIIGVIDLIGIILMRTLPWMDWGSSILHTDIPASLSTWMQGLINDVTAVALPLAIGIMVAGIALLVASFIIPAKEKEVL